VQNELEKSYPDLATTTESELDPNSSYSKVLGLIEGPGRVLDVGCATGYLARLLSARGCSVTGLDSNAKALQLAGKFCDRTLAADLDSVALTDLFPDDSFDVIIFADVLEHLRNPWKVLDDARRLLGHRGHAVVSIPNIAHGAIRLALLKGHFDYSEFGILDNTHLRFFTRRTIEELFVRSGYEIERWERTMLPLFSPSSLVPDLDPADFEPVTIEKIRRDADFETLQFVISGRALTDDAKLLQIADRYVAANTKLETLAESQVSREFDERLVRESAATEVALRAAERENVRLTELLQAATSDGQIARETAEQLRGERIYLRDVQRREAELQLQISDLSNSFEMSVTGLEARISASNDELRHQREAYDELCIQLTTAREIAQRATERLSIDMLLIRNNELAEKVKTLVQHTHRYLAVRESRYWKMADAARRTLRRLGKRI
jgi:2-polyprenyl-3-methyl-5-hydroxy-6-metoxy-1,4-benzoquinol methylase